MEERPELNSEEAEHLRLLAYQVELHGQALEKNMRRYQDAADRVFAMQVTRLAATGNPTT